MGYLKETDFEIFKKSIEGKHMKYLVYLMSLMFALAFVGCEKAKDIDTDVKETTTKTVEEATEAVGEVVKEDTEAVEEVTIEAKETVIDTTDQ